MHRHWTYLPNFVDTAVFRPAADAAERAVCRKRFGIPEASFVVGCVAAVKSHHKRIDYLIREFAAFAEHGGRSGGVRGCEPFLAVAGASTPETGALRGLVERLAPGRHRMLTDLSRQDMPAFYRALDIFVLPSLFEMMPVAVLEALASGLPVTLNRHPVLEWMAGEGGGKAESGKLKADSPSTIENRKSKIETSPSSSSSGWCLDMSREGALAAQLGVLTPEALTERARAARGRAVAEFSTEAVIDRYVAYYREVMASEGGVSLQFRHWEEGKRETGGDSRAALT